MISQVTIQDAYLNSALDTTRMVAIFSARLILLPTFRRISIRQFSIRHPSFKNRIRMTNMNHFSVVESHVGAVVLFRDDLFYFIYVIQNLFLVFFLLKSVQH